MRPEHTTRISLFLYTFSCGLRCMRTPTKSWPGPEQCRNTVHTNAWSLAFNQAGSCLTDDGQVEGSDGEDGTGNVNLISIVLYSSHPAYHLFINGASTADKRSMIRSNPMNRSVMRYSMTIEGF